MKKNVIPDFSRKRPGVGPKPVVEGEKAHSPSPRQPMKPPTQAKNAGHRGS
ncbi:MAG: hypothetical protein AAB224_05170 [Gemmatimonadota bacterium]